MKEEKLLDRILSSLFDEFLLSAPSVYQELIEYLISDMCDSYWMLSPESHTVRFDWAYRQRGVVVPKSVRTYLGMGRRRFCRVVVLMSVAKHNRSIQIVCTDADRSVLSWHQVTHRWWHPTYWKSVYLVKKLREWGGGVDWVFHYCGKRTGNSEQLKDGRRIWWFPFIGGDR